MISHLKAPVALPTFVIFKPENKDARGQPTRLKDAWGAYV